jgi:hypothetical protein
LAVFERACDLVSVEEQGSPQPGPPLWGERRRRVIGLVAPEIGDGPLNVVLDEDGWDFTAVEPGTPARIDGGELRVGGLQVDLRRAEVWEPRPDWKALRERRDAIAHRLPALRAVGLAHARTGSLLTLLGGYGNPPYMRLSRKVSREEPLPPVFLSAAGSALPAIEAGWGGDRGRLREGAAQLAGLGGGLTPAGDDFLCGAMLWAWLAHPRPGSLCRAMAASAAPRTTTLSAAFLWAAAHGECSAAWHALFDALSQGDDALEDVAVRELLLQGASSGADALAGFLWAGTHVGSR